MVEHLPTKPQETEPSPYKTILFDKKVPRREIAKTVQSMANIRARAGFPARYLQTKEEIKGDLLGRDTSTFLLYDEQKLIGFSVVYDPKIIDLKELMPENTDTAHIMTTVIDARYRKKGLVGTLMHTVEDYLRQEGYVYLEREAMVNNGYAEAIRRHYGEGIIYEAEADDNLPNHPRQFFSIKL